MGLLLSGDSLDSTEPIGAGAVGTVSIMVAGVRVAGVGCRLEAAVLVEEAVSMDPAETSALAFRGDADLSRGTV